MKQVLLFVIMTLGYTGLFAQLEVKPTIGINFSNVSKDPETGEASGNAGWQFGGSLLYGTKFYSEIGVFYQQRSTEFTSDVSSELNFDKKVSGIRVPLSVGLHILGSEESLAALRIFGGGSGFFVTNVDGGNLDKDDINSPQWGVFAGAGLDIWILFIEYKYEWSLTDVSSITEFDVGKYRSSFINAGARFQF